MNEYEKLMDYLNVSLNSINERIRQVHEKNEELKTVKANLESVIQKISERKLLEVNTVYMKDSLLVLLAEEQTNEIMMRFNDCVSMASYLMDERISSPLKQAMLDDLVIIQENLIDLRKKFDEQKYDISESDLKGKKELEGYLKILDQDGFHRVLSNDERIKFYNFLKTSGMDSSDILLLIKDYIQYALKSKRQEEILTSNSSIDIVNNNAEVIIKDLEKQAQIEEVPKEETPVVIEVPNLSEDYQKIYEEILELLEKNQSSVDQTTYDLYKNMYANLDVLTIFEQRASFLDVNGVDWGKAVPCLKEKLIPMINSENRELIFQIFNCIISLYKNQIKQQDETTKLNKEYSKKLKDFKEDFKNVAMEARKLQTESEPIIAAMNSKLNSDMKANVITILEMVETQSKESIGKEYFEAFGFTYEQAKIYLLSNKMNKNIDYVREFIEIGISADDFEDVKNELKEVKSFISEFKHHYVVLLEEIKQAQKEQGKQGYNKQYESGKNIIVFYRKDEDSKFLIEEDIEQSDNITKNYFYVEKILKTVNDTEYWHWKEKRYYNFREDINSASSKTDSYKFYSNYSGKNLEFSRLKAPIQKKNEDNNTRVSCLKIDLCEENRRKLNLPSRTVILVIGEMNISNHNTNSEYSYFRTQLEENSKEIQRIVELFENPNTPEEVLSKLLNDSSDLYNILRVKPKEV